MLTQKKINLPPEHSNEFEHREKFIPFLLYFLFYGFVGGIIGRLLDSFISALKHDDDSKQKSVLLYFLQLLINGIFFFIAFKTITIKSKYYNYSLSLDDWIGSTFQGLIFATTMYSMQNNLYVNLSQGLL
jgi:H+/Cl- antiporter ClcA